MNIALPRSLNVDEFLTWAERQEQGKYELVDGVVIMQQSQQWGHARVKARVFKALERSVEAQGLDYFAAPDGMTVRITDGTAFEPDALVASLPEPADDSLEVPDPVIVVEVLSPPTARIDATTKLSGYFEVASVQHYLIVDPEGRMVAHHKRGPSAIETSVVSTGSLRLEPPGIEIALADVFGPARA